MVFIPCCCWLGLARLKISTPPHKRQELRWLMGTISHLHNSGGSLLSHVVNGILVSEPIRSLHCVIEMPPPVILLHVPQSCIDPTLLARATLDKSANPHSHNNVRQHVKRGQRRWCTCAATVWDLVGKSLVMQAVLKPASDRPKAALSPAPPAPTTTASNSWSTTGYCVEIWKQWRICLCEQDLSTL